MKKIVSYLILFFYLTTVKAQNFTGQWKGSFVDKSTSISWGSNQCDYVLELEAKGKKIKGYSYTYFNEGGKKYYTICTVAGTLDTKTKFVEIIETARTKTNVPVNISNSFQKHKLRWYREAGKEILEGNWEPAPGQNNGNTGFGSTTLTKRVLTEIYPIAKQVAKITTPFNTPKKKIDAIITPKQNAVANNPKKPIAKPNIIAKVPSATTKKKPEIIIQKKPLIISKIPTPTTTPKNTIPTIDNAIEKNFPLGFETRNTSILQTVQVENDEVNIELYDNGDIDGDSVSLIYNGELILAHKKLTTQPIKINLPIKEGSINELVMYADNLGTLPPNTALMIVMDGQRRYEVRITSDLKKSGTIRFAHKKTP